VWTVRPPVVRIPSAVRGHRVFGVTRAAVHEVAVEMGERRFTARRSAGSWVLDGTPASPAAAAALDDLVDVLVHLRAVDVFRPRDGSSFGLEQPTAVVTLTTSLRTRRVLVGAANTAGSTFYARRDGSPRVVQIGAGVLSQLERVFYQRDRTNQ
jgi:Domain of unknown function (DUF4340)